MNSKLISVWILTTYLAVLLSWGDALHRLPCFGHHHSTIEKASVADTDNLCCGHHHLRCHQSENPKPPAEFCESASSEDGPCLICEFFAKYHASVGTFELAKTADPHRAQVYPDHRAANSAIIPPAARGPPLS
ncbi:MAG: hypothetical protein P8M80_13020 [Pirellulaceae bacterium]|jgi:hypothetical protein|nr:hypothetical protein [Pirellulaceae bacterium]MDG2470196.1 hypothetical protein [Pirellulaceae bacterium]